VNTTDYYALSCNLLVSYSQDRFSPRARDLCSRLLAKDPATRLGAGGGTDIMSHPWFEDLDWDRLAQVPTTVLFKLVHFDFDLMSL
jgi:hypothetical protein